jgi:hypothetical protein
LPYLSSVISVIPTPLARPIFNNTHVIPNCFSGEEPAFSL